MASGGVAAFLTILFVDWLLSLPPTLRIVAAGLFLAGFVIATLHWIVRPLQARFDLGEVASQLEARFDSLQDRLVSAVNFIEHGGTGSPRMMKRVVSSTEKVLNDLRLESALALRPLVNCASVMVVSFAALFLLSAGAPDWIRTGAYRYIYPWGQFEWPRDVSIRPLTDDRVVAIGASVEVSMKIERGWSETTRAIVRFREPNGSTSALTMKRDVDGIFRATIDAVTTDLTYWFEAGDDSTQPRPGVIRAVRRPEVVEAFLTIEPPPYASGRPSRVLALSVERVSAPQGGHVLISLQISKPIRVNPEAAVLGLRTDSGELIPLSADKPLSDRLSTRFEVVNDLTFSIELQDEHGIENHRSDRFTIVAEPDRPPTVAILLPGAVTEVTRSAVVNLHVRAEDDFGFDSLEWEVERVGEGESETRPLDARPESEAAGNRVRVTVSEAWDLSPLSLAEGEELLCRAAARDNRAESAGGGQVSKSVPVRIKIISESDLEARLRNDTAALEARIRKLALDQAELLDETRDLRRRTDTQLSTADVSRVDRQAAKDLAAQQVRIARRTQDVSDRFRSLRQRVVRNRLDDNDAAVRFSELASTLQQIAAEPMPSASRLLAEVRQAPDTVSANRDLDEAAAREEAALDRLRFALASLSHWGGFHELISNTRDLIDRQETVRTQTAEFGKSLIGRAVSSLERAEAAGIERLARQQEQLATDIQGLVTRMKQMVSTAQNQGSSDQEAVDAALRVGRAREVTRNSQTATEAVRSNRTAAAAIAQRSTVEGLRKMVTALQRHDRRQLDELRKHLERAQDQVAWLIRQQEELRSATREADQLELEKELTGPLATDQRTLKRNTRLLGDDLAAVHHSIAVAQIVRSAAKPMGDAEAHLRVPTAERVDEAQGEALALLREAVERLEEVARESEQAALRRSLAQIREDLEQLSEEQRAVNAGITELIEAVTKRGRIGRLEARRASKLARRQHDVRTMLQEQVDDFSEVAVYQWALERIAGWMDESRAQLSGRNIDDQLTLKGKRIVRELEKLIQAIVETEALPVDTQFVEAGRGGGGSQGKSGKRKPVPSVAELLVLKAMQGDVNQRTTIFDDSVDLEDATEMQLHELTALAEDQKEIQRLTWLVTQRVRQP